MLGDHGARRVGLVSPRRPYLWLRQEGWADLHQGGGESGEENLTLLQAASLAFAPLPFRLLL